jgi:glycine C-acetyltransferase/8-amino-7-oxononanoate synthase
MNEPEPLQQVRRTYVRFQGRVLSYFSGCDYFRLAGHPQVRDAVVTGLRRYGLNVAASRLTTGNHVVYPALEKQLAQFFGEEAALLINSGYATNLILAQTVTGHFSHALLDEKAHLSLMDAAQLLNCPVLKFQHRNVEDFAATLNRCGRGARPVVLTDGMFSRDGSVAPLRAYLKLLPRDGLMVVDDAHGAGILGAQGRGAVEVEKVDDRRLVQCVTLSKAFGVYGGAILGSKKLRGQILERSPMFTGSTPLPLPLAYAATVAVKLVKQNPSLRQRLNANADFVKNGLRHAGLNLPDAPGPVIPFMLPTPKQNAALRRTLLAAGIFPSFINYHGIPEDGYFRFVISSEHSRHQLEQLVQVLKPFVH